MKRSRLQGKKNKTSVVVSTAGKGENHQVLHCPRISVDPVSFNPWSYFHAKLVSLFVPDSYFGNVNDTR